MFIVLAPGRGQCAVALNAVASLHRLRISPLQCLLPYAQVGTNSIVHYDSVSPVEWALMQNTQTTRSDHWCPRNESESSTTNAN